MDPYNAQSYYNDALSGLNQRGDSGNGLYGSLTSGAINNQSRQTPNPSSYTSTASQGTASSTKSSNPYGEILNYIQPQPMDKPGGVRLTGAPISAQQPAAQASAPMAANTSAGDEAARQLRAQWYLDNIAKYGLDPNDPKNFIDGKVFDLYGNYVTAPTPPPPPSNTPPDRPPDPGEGPRPVGPPIPVYQHERFNPYADWQAENMYNAAGVKPIEPNIGETKTFPNGNVGRWDGIGWEHIDANGNPTHSGQGGW